jgi:Cu(I)/Ag(I) efflux system membrane fusion protein
MNRTTTIGAAALAATAALAAGYWLGTRSHPAPEAAPAEGASAAAKSERKLLYYRNPMGLPDTSPVPKKDPMGMDYIAVYEGEAPPKAGTVKISLDKVQLLGVRTEPAAERELRRAVQAVGTIQANERRLYKVTPRFEGWIEKLHVNTTGQPVALGQPLMAVYSPELVTAQEEYLIALRAIEESRASGPEAQAVMQRMAEGVLRRLHNWGIAQSELETLRKEGKARQLLTYRSPAAGVVLQKPSVQGMRFMPGETLYEIADLSVVWLVAEVFERDLGLVKPGQEAKLRILAYPEREFAGKVVFVSPILEPDTRTARVRIELANPGGLLKPSMYGSLELFAVHPRGKVLAVPESAVLDSGNRQAVLVQRGEGLFEPRSVKLGMRAGGYVEVLDGVAAGDEVVVRANFLIDAESNLKAALETFGKPAQPAASQLHRGLGTVQAVNAKSGTVEIEHGPIASLKWPAMSMEFKVRDKSLLQHLKPGQAVAFDLSQPKPGEYVIESIKGH